MGCVVNVDGGEGVSGALVISAGGFRVTETVEIVASIVSSGALEPSALDRQRLANLALASRVEATVLGDPTVWVNSLKVVAQEGRVRIDGEVITEEDRDAVKAVVRSVDGVRLNVKDLCFQPLQCTGMIH